MKMNKIFQVFGLMALAMMGVMSSCSSSTGEIIPAPKEEEKDLDKDYTPELIADGEVLAQAANFDTNFNGDPQFLTLAGKTDFAINLAKLTGESEKNFFVSPLSIQMVYAILANGAEKKTYDEITEAIGLRGLTKDQLREYGKLLLNHYAVSEEEDVNARRNARELALSNVVWTDKFTPVYESFFSSSRSFFDAETYAIDFTANDAEQVINKWVSDNTAGRIPSMVTRDEVKNLSFLMINAAYMKASWMHSFVITEPGTFNNADGEKPSCTMMKTTLMDCRYKNSEDYQVASLPLGNDAYVMNILLPHNDKTVDDILKALDSEALLQIAQNSNSELLNVELPQFDLESELELSSMMQELGIHEVFTKEANLKAFSPVDHYVTLSKHKANISVTKYGLEASAASLVGGSYIDPGPGFEKPTPIPFHVDRPFLFTIQDVATGGIIFVGQVKNL